MSVITNSLAGLAATSVITVDGNSPPVGMISCNISGTFSLTITFEASPDGANWQAVNGIPLAGGAATSTATAAGAFVFPNLGYSQFRARVSSYTSGAATVSFDTSGGALSLPLAPNGGGMTDTGEASGNVAAPAGGADIIAAQTPGAGTWEITISAGTQVGTPVAADTMNMKLMKNASVLTNLAFPFNGMVTLPTIRVTLGATDTIGIKAIGAATATVQYMATMVWKKVA